MWHRARARARDVHPGRSSAVASHCAGLAGPQHARLRADRADLLPDSRQQHTVATSRGRRAQSDDGSEAFARSSTTLCKRPALSTGSQTCARHGISKLMSSCSGSKQRWPCWKMVARVRSRKAMAHLKCDPNIFRRPLTHSQSCCALRSTCPTFPGAAFCERRTRSMALSSQRSSTSGNRERRGAA